MEMITKIMVINTLDNNRDTKILELRETSLKVSVTMEIMNSEVDKIKSFLSRFKCRINYCHRTCRLVKFVEKGSVNSQI